MDSATLLLQLGVDADEVVYSLLDLVSVGEDGVESVGLLEQCEGSVQLERGTSLVIQTLLEHEQLVSLVGELLEAGECDHGLYCVAFHGD